MLWVVDLQIDAGFDSLAAEAGFRRQTQGANTLLLNYLSPTLAQLLTRDRALSSNSNEFFEQGYLAARHEKTGGSARESNPPRTAKPPRNGFEDRETHRNPSTPALAYGKIARGQEHIHLAWRFPRIREPEAQYRRGLAVSADRISLLESVGDVVVGADRRRGTIAGRADNLARRILPHVAGGEDPGHICLHPVVHQDVLPAVHLQRAV